VDRAYIPDHQRISKWASEDWVSLGWMRTDGSRDFRLGTGREPPRIEAGPPGRGTIFLCDYDGPIEQADTVRLHPARHRSKEPLPDALRRHARAVGYQTSALVQAGLMGLEVVCKDPRNIMAQPNWLDLLPYADWHYSEIQSGEAIAHVFDFDH